MGNTGAGSMDRHDAALEHKMLGAPATEMRVLNIEEDGHIDDKKRADNQEQLDLDDIKEVDKIKMGETVEIPAEDVLQEVQAANF